MCRGIPLTAALCLLDVCGRQVNFLFTRFHDDPKCSTNTKSCLLNNKTSTPACFGDRHCLPATVGSANYLAALSCAATY